MGGGGGGVIVFQRERLVGTKGWSKKIILRERNTRLDRQKVRKVTECKNGLTQRESMVKKKKNKT